MIGIYTVWEITDQDCGHDILAGIYDDKKKMKRDFPGVGKELSEFYWIWITINRDRRNDV